MSVQQNIRTRARMWRVAAGVASATAGALLGTAMQEYSDTPIRLLSIIAIAIAVVLIAVCVALLVFSRDADEIEKAWEERASAERRELLDGLRSLEQQVGVQVVCQSVTELNQHNAAEDDKVIQAIRAAASKIYILDIAPASGRRPDASVRRQIMSVHFDALNAKAAGGIEYKRVTQVEDVARGLRGISDETFLRHYSTMCARRESRDITATLKVTKLRYPYEFIIIDERIVIVQLHEVDAAERLTWCEMIVSDPSQEMIGTFLGMWNDLYDSEFSRTMSRREVDTVIAAAQEDDPDRGEPAAS